MPLVISDEWLKQAGLTEQQMKIEIACRLFDAGKLHLWPAAQMAGLSRGEFEDELMQRGIAPYRMDEQYVRQELEYASQFGCKGEPNSDEDNQHETGERGQR